MLPLAPAPTMAFGRACASAPRAAGKPLAEASSTLANRACLNRGADGEANCAHRSAASRDRDAQRGGAERRGGGGAAADRTAGSRLMDPSGTVAAVPGYQQASADRFRGGGTLRKHRSSPVASAPTLAISAPYSAPKQQSVFETAGSREDAEKEKDRQRKAADAERVATLLEFDVEFEHAVLYRSLQFAFDDVNPAPALDLTAGSDLIKGNWQTHIGAMVGKETASAVAESLIQRRIKEFAALRESEDGPMLMT
jgi:hypothetical protein